MEIKDALEIAQENYTDYSRYVAMGRAYPNIKDGCKSAYKRAIYGMWKDGPRSIVKCAKLASYALPYHPHPSSISGVIVQLGNNGNKLKLMETQGNWGDSSKGIAPSADRYIGGMLSDLAIKLFCDSCQYTKMIKGEIDEDEPEALPALIPLCFINGLGGIPSGLPTLNIPTVDIIDMFNYYIEVLNHKSVDYVPNWVPGPNLGINIVSPKSDWENIMKTGKGSIRLAPVMEQNNNTITITALPSPKTVEHVRKIIEKEILQDKVDVRDESTSDTCIVVEKVPKKWCDMNDIYKRLYKGLQVSESYNMAFFDQERIYVPCGFNKVVRENINYLIETHTNRIIQQIQSLRSKLLVLEIIQDIKRKNHVIKLAGMNNREALDFICGEYSVDADVATKVLQKPISYLTREHDQELADLQNEISSLENDKSDIYEFLVKKYKQMKKEISRYIDGKYVRTVFI